MRKCKKPAPKVVKKARKRPELSAEPSLEDRVETTDQFICEVLKLFEDLQKIINKLDKAR